MELNAMLGALLLLLAACHAKEFSQAIGMAQADAEGGPSSELMLTEDRHGKNGKGKELSSGENGHGHKTEMGDNGKSGQQEPTCPADTELQVICGSKKSKLANDDCGKLTQKQSFFCGHSEPCFCNEHHVCLGGGDCNEGNLFLNTRPVCDDYWKDTLGGHGEHNANVVCKQLGFARAVSFTTNRGYNYVRLQDFALLDASGSRMNWNTIGYNVTDTGHDSGNPGKTILRGVSGVYESKHSPASFSNQLPANGPVMVTIDVTNPVIFSQFELARYGSLSYSPQDWTLEGQLGKGDWQLIYTIKGFKFESTSPAVFDVIKSSVIGKIGKWKDIVKRILEEVKEELEEVKEELLTENEK